jgi:hypothetical protein
MRPQPAVNAVVISIWQEWPTGAHQRDAIIGRRRKTMGMRKIATVALIAMAGVGAAVLPGVSFAQSSPAAAASPQMASSLSAADKDALMKKLEEAKKHDKIARAGWSQEPLTQATYDTKIDQIKALIAKLKKGEDFPMSDVDKAVASPGSAPY